MKQIVINADPDTHTWLKETAKKERRTMGQQALVFLGMIRPPTRRTVAKLGAVTPMAEPEIYPNPTRRTAGHRKGAKV